ncbi:SIR2 family protein [Pseudomonas aeruginosa]|uniref:SIR2 family protein n=3 Tax=Pseudomonas aeruginosa TaxID=287 RepID=UPI0013EFCEFF|nr:SIR2 family protein [Pseudomonas aeruginosa]ELK4838817.1 SIR2 family protein [Pseudomonas aeruginosa]QII96335.1 SIR2 family protein [Pseudomonas aeruginosa]HCF5317812.1 SIR2 family protein [Pseudomonas aeruginosa]HCF5319639.1 SIR2 family protein [Pseudomonas aeruginosa]HEJ1452818.1 SIR2 family protein [Pseudomonas aeruginosa]
MSSEYEKYITDISDDIKACIEEMGCQPILFIGSGLTKRYLNGPNWEELLQNLADQCPEIDKRFAYYKQRYSDPVDIGAVFSEKYNEWAWSSGESEFPKELFEQGNPPDIYIKHSIAKIFIDLLEKNKISNETEIELLKKIHPHSIITTNYDQLLESIFPDYEPIVGQKILYANHASIGEIFKIHGCISNPSSIIINRDDYNSFIRKKKYLSAKLLAFFAEHPLVFIGYSAEDQNIKAILSDIDELLSENGELIPNIYILEWSNSEPITYPRRERLIQVSENKSVRIKSIVAHDFSWVFEAFSANKALENVNPKLLRALLARTYSLVRSDIPKNPVQLDYSLLANVSEVDGELAKLYGIANAADGVAFNANYPFTLSAIGRALGYRGWHDAQKLLEVVKNTTGVDIKSFDNIYHCAIMNGDTVQSHRYSAPLKRLLEKVKSGEEFHLEIKP